jgi:hypothetical protein
MTSSKEPTVPPDDHALRRLGASLATRTAYRRWAELGCRADVDRLLGVAFAVAERAIGERSAGEVSDAREVARGLEQALSWALGAPGLAAEARRPARRPR